VPTNPTSRSRLGPTSACTFGEAVFTVTPVDGAYAGKSANKSGVEKGWGNGTGNVAVADFHCSSSAFISFVGGHHPYIDFVPAETVAQAKGITAMAFALSKVFILPVDCSPKLEASSFQNENTRCCYLTFVTSSHLATLCIEGNRHPFGGRRAPPIAEKSSLFEVRVVSFERERLPLPRQCSMRSAQKSELMTGHIVLKCAAREHLR
jgi:hypothetical protein